jgi:hypothetical protein
MDKSAMTESLNNWLSEQNAERRAILDKAHVLYKQSLFGYGKVPAFAVTYQQMRILDPSCGSIEDITMFGVPILVLYQDQWCPPTIPDLR